MKIQNLKNKPHNSRTLHLSLIVIIITLCLIAWAFFLTTPAKGGADRPKPKSTEPSTQPITPFIYDTLNRNDFLLTNYKGLIKIVFLTNKKLNPGYDKIYDSELGEDSHWDVKWGQKGKERNPSIKIYQYPNKLTITADQIVKIQLNGVSTNLSIGGDIYEHIEITQEIVNNKGMITLKTTTILSDYQKEEITKATKAGIKVKLPSNLSIIFYDLYQLTTFNHHTRSIIERLGTNLNDGESPNIIYFNIDNLNYQLNPNIPELLDLSNTTPDQELKDEIKKYLTLLDHDDWRERLQAQDNLQTLGESTIKILHNLYWGDPNLLKEYTPESKLSPEQMARISCILEIYQSVDPEILTRLKDLASLTSK